jgi:DNA polymerase (family 10)
LPPCLGNSGSAARYGETTLSAQKPTLAADNLLTLTLSLEQIIAEERLREIPGIGEAIADIIKKLHATGTHSALEKMRKEIPVGVLEMLTVPGLRPDKVLKLHQELGLSSLAELEEAAREGRLQKIKGLGASLQTKILRGIEMQRAAQGRWHMHRAAELLKTAERHLREARPDIIRISAGRSPSRLRTGRRPFHCCGG